MKLNISKIGTFVLVFVFTMVFSLYALQAEEIPTDDEPDYTIEEDNNEREPEETEEPEEPDVTEPGEEEETEETEETPVLDTPVIAIDNNGVLHWSIVSYAVGYEIYINGVSQITLEGDASLFDLNRLDLAEGSYLIQVKALGNEDFADSELSDELVFTVAPVITPPINTVPNQNQPNFDNFQRFPNQQQDFNNFGGFRGGRGRGGCGCWWLWNQGQGF